MLELAKELLMINQAHMMAFIVAVQLPIVCVAAEYVAASGDRKLGVTKLMHISCAITFFTLIVSLK